MENLDRLIPLISLSGEAERIIIGSLLDEHGIAYHVSNQTTQDLFGIGRFGGYNYITGPQKIMVTEQDAARARELILSVKQQSAGNAEDEELKQLQEYNIYVNGALIIGLILPGLNFYHLFRALYMKLRFGDKLGGSFKLMLSGLLMILGLYLGTRLFVG